MHFPDRCLDFVWLGGGLDIINLAVDVDAFCCPEPLFFGTCTFYMAQYKIVFAFLGFDNPPVSHTAFCSLKSLSIDGPQKDLVLSRGIGSA